MNIQKNYLPFMPKKFFKKRSDWKVMHLSCPRCDPILKELEGPAKDRSAS